MAFGLLGSPNAKALVALGRLTWSLTVWGLRWHSCVKLVSAQASWLLVYDLSFQDGLLGPRTS